MAGDGVAGVVSSIVDRARRRPGSVLAWILGLHLVSWTLIPALISANLQLDLVEGLALGREWQLGYWKHPPLPWWVTDLAYRLTGLIDAVYLLGPLAAITCLYVVWLLAREIAGELNGLIAVIALEAVHYYNFSAVKFAHDQMQLPFWALTGLFTWRAIARGRLIDWALAGLFLAGAFWSKYAAITLALTLGVVLLVDPFARRTWRTAGPYLMALTFSVVMAPNLWWLINNDFMPFQYVDSRAIAAARWYQHILFPLIWIGSQLAFLLPLVALMALLYWPQGAIKRPDADGLAVFNIRFVVALAIGPFAVTAAAAMLLGRQPVALWGYPLWSFLPLAVLVVWPPQLDLVRLRRFAIAAMGVLAFFPLLFIFMELGEPFLRDRPKATQFAGRFLADTVTREWRERTGTPLTYVGGAIVIGNVRGALREVRGAGQFPANNVAVYSPDRPHVIVNGELKFSPWIDPQDLERRGVVLVWQSAAKTGVLPENIQRAFPRAELQPPLLLPRSTLYPRRAHFVEYAFVPPAP